MASEPLEQRLDAPNTSPKTAGPYNFHPIAHINNEGLIISRQPTPDIQIVKREWNFKDWLIYLFCDKKPSTTIKKHSYKPTTEIARFLDARSFTIIEKDKQYWVEYE